MDDPVLSPEAQQGILMKRNTHKQMKPGVNVVFEEALTCSASWREAMKSP